MSGATTGSAFQGFRSSGAPGGSQAGDKVKFTVSVHGHQWSSARHVHETLEEFARVIERNAKRLEFIGDSDTIQRLQLVRPDGSEPEELDVDATLEDVLICMGDKQLVAKIPSDSLTTKELLHQATPDDPKPSQSSPENHRTCLPSSSSFFPKSTETPNSYTLTPTSAPLAENNDSPTPGCSKDSPPGYGVRSLKFPSCEYSSAPVFPDLDTKSLYGAQGGLNNFLSAGASTPTPAELAQFLVRGSSSSRPMTGAGNSIFRHCAPAASPVPVFAPGCHQSAFVPSIGSRAFQGASPGCSQGGGAPNIALLAQFLAAQLKAFTPAQENPAETSGKSTFLNQNEAAGGSHHRARTSHRPTQEASKHPGAESQDEKDASSSSANINNPGFSSSFGVPDSSDPAKGRSELVFLVNRRSKMGVGTHHLKMSDLSSYFHLSIVDAAKKLGVSQTTLKKACRKFGLKRWPGRKVRSLESTIHGLEHTIAVGQGAGMEDLTEAYMRSEVLKLQQEMDQLVHGVPAAQHLPMVRTADLYKRLYSRGWRSKFHSPCNRLDIDLNTQSKEEENSKSSRAQECSWRNTQESPSNKDSGEPQQQQCNENYHQSIQDSEEADDDHHHHHQQQNEVEEMTTEERSAKKPKVEQPAS